MIDSKDVAAEGVRSPEALLPHGYLFAKCAMVVPLLQEARDALTALSETQRVMHGISKTLAARMDIAGTYSLDDWLADAKPTMSADGGKNIPL